MLHVAPWINKMYRVVVFNYAMDGDVRVHEASTATELAAMIEANYNAYYLGNLVKIVSTPGYVSRINIRESDPANEVYPTVGQQDYRLIVLPRLPVTDPRLAACASMTSLSLARTLSGPFSGGRKKRSGRSKSRSKTRRHRK
jgi:hypothetical protein